mmetsp:Transcript_11129/g.15359  ORF Transcript_11129/g.15359 Transcript_11129/m.15359 type:complete len:243 (-) Transcript_11129:63-791(-)
MEKLVVWGLEAKKHENKQMKIIMVLDLATQEHISQDTLKVLSTFKSQMQAFCRNLMMRKMTSQNQNRQRQFHHLLMERIESCLIVMMMKVLRKKLITNHLMWTLEYRSFLARARRTSLKSLKTTQRTRNQNLKRKRKRRKKNKWKSNLNKKNLNLWKRRRRKRRRRRRSFQRTSPSQSIQKDGSLSKNALTSERRARRRLWRSKLKVLLKRLQMARRKPLLHLQRRKLFNNHNKKLLSHHLP